MASVLGALQPQRIRQVAQVKPICVHAPGFALDRRHFEDCPPGELMLSHSEAMAMARFSRLHRPGRCRVILAVPQGPLPMDSASKCRLSVSRRRVAPRKGVPKSKTKATLQTGLTLRQRICAKSAVTSSLRRSSRTLARLKAFSESCVTEVTSDRLRRAALDLLMSKPTFLPEKHLVRARVYEKVAYVCRTYLLIDGSVSHRRQDSKRSFLSCLTVCLNRYAAPRTGYWAQVLNICARVERRGYGTRLFSEVERELLARDGIDVLVCYPVDKYAELFWQAVGFANHKHKASLLPDKELVPISLGGNLIPEAQGSNGAALSRWEKRIPNS